MLSISSETPLTISTRDIDKNGSVDPLMFNSQQNKKGDWDMFPVQFWDNLTQQSPLFRKEFNSYHSFSKANMDYYQEKGYLINDSLLFAKHDTSKWVENLGSGQFNIKNLPAPLQLGPINDFLVLGTDYDQSIFMIGNDFGGPPFEGNFDAFQGAIINTNTMGNKKVLEAQDSGFHVFGDAREISSIRMLNGKTLILVTQNQSRLPQFPSSEHLLHTERQGRIFLLPPDQLALLPYRQGCRHTSPCKQLSQASVILLESTALLMLDCLLSGREQHYAQPSCLSLLASRS